MPELDLHGLTPAQALRRLKAELHTCRVRGDSALTVITGQGFGNKLQQPVLALWSTHDDLQQLYGDPGRDLALLGSRCDGTRR